jgi:RNA polymerase sigma factor (sigma-70 family)
MWQRTIFRRNFMNLPPNSIDENTILQRIALGEETAFADCLDKYGKLVWALAKTYLQTIEDAEDAVQEIFFEVWQNAERYDADKASEITFIGLIARRRLIDKVRKYYRTPITSSIDESFQAPKYVYEDKIHQKIEAKKIVKAMNVLRPKQKNLMMLTIFEGMSHGEIAKSTGIPLGTVKTCIRTGFSRLRTVLNVNPQI